MSAPGPGCCPRDDVLSRAFTDGAEATLEAHLAGCAECSAAWRDLGELADVARGCEETPGRKAFAVTPALRVALAAAQQRGTALVPRLHQLSSRMKTEPTAPGRVEVPAPRAEGEFRLAGGGVIEDKRPQSHELAVWVPVVPGGPLRAGAS